MRLPPFRGLDSACNILIVGTGCDFDLLSALPLCLSLLEKNKNVYLANYSFASIHGGSRLSSNLVELDFSSKPSALSSSEVMLFDWSEKLKLPVPIFCFDGKPGCQRLFEAFQLLYKELDLDAIVLVDRGLSNLGSLRSGEIVSDLETMTSFLAIEMLPEVETKIVAGFGVGPELLIDEKCIHDIGFELSPIWQTDEFLGLMEPGLSRENRNLFLNACDYFESNLLFGFDKYLDRIFRAYKDRSDDSVESDFTLATSIWCFDLLCLADSTCFIPNLEETKSLDDVAWELTKFKHSRRR